MRVLFLAAALAGQTTSPDGIWLSDGYGLLFEIQGDTLEGWEVTGISCLSSMDARSVPAPHGSWGAFRLTDRPVTLVLLPDPDAARMRVHVNGTASDMVVRRVGEKPSVCRAIPPDGPEFSFDVFAETWAEHYPFFSMKGADWPALVSRNRARVTNDTTPEQLFAVFEEMVAPFDDAHTFILAESLDRRFQGSRRSRAWVERAERERAYGLVTKYLSGPLRSFCEGPFEQGMLGEDVGYLRLRSFSGYHADGSFESGLAALESALDDIFAEARNWRGLVIDVRINNGGDDPYGLAIARRLTEREYVAYAKQARNDPTNETSWTSEQPSVVTPTGRPGFAGEVVELIGIQSISAAETFTQALLGRRPEVVRVGENTQGVFSDVLRRKLPNGWIFGLPNERFLTDGRSYDGPGIAPHVTVLSFTPEGMDSGRDAGIEKALELLRGR